MTSWSRLRRGSPGSGGASPYLRRASRIILPRGAIPVNFIAGDVIREAARVSIESLTLMGLVSQPRVENEDDWG